MFYPQPQASASPMLPSTFNMPASPAAPLGWLNALSPYQQALILPLLQQMVPSTNSPQMQPIVIDDSPIQIQQQQPLPMLTHLMPSQNLFNNNSQYAKEISGVAPASPFLASASQRSPNFFVESLHTDSTQENSPHLAFYNTMGTNNAFFSNDLFSLQQDNSMSAKNPYATVKPSLHHPHQLTMNMFAQQQQQQQQQTNEQAAIPAALASSISKKVKKSVTKQAPSSSIGSPLIQPISTNGNNNLYGGSVDDKNIIHINFTKNLLKSFRRYCEYFHKQNTAMLAQIKSDFETNHMNNQLLVHFMTSPLTIETFKGFVDGPAQKWVKEQSRLKKQDQQLELIEICRQRLFEKIKVKKYSDNVPVNGSGSGSSPISIDENNQVTTIHDSIIESSQQQQQLQPVKNNQPKNSDMSKVPRKRPIFAALKSHQHQASKEAKIRRDSEFDSQSSSSSSSSDSFGQNSHNEVMLNGAAPYKRICNRNEEAVVVLREEDETKIEDFDHNVKVEAIEDDDEEEF